MDRIGDIAELVRKKQRSYGDSYGKSCEVLKVLYPDGVTPDGYKDLLAVTRVIDKLFRVANDKGAFDENPWADIVGYGLLAMSADSIHRRADQVLEEA